VHLRQSAGPAEEIACRCWSRGTPDTPCEIGFENKYQIKALSGTHFSAESDCEHLTKQAVATLGRAHILINNNAVYLCERAVQRRGPYSNKHGCGTFGNSILHQICVTRNNKKNTQGSVVGFSSIAGWLKYTAGKTRYSALKFCETVSGCFTRGT